MRVEDAAASGCQLDEHKKIASELAAEEDYNLKSPFFSSSCSSSSALWQRVVLRFIVLSVAIRNLLAGANPITTSSARQCECVREIYKNGRRLPSNGGGAPLLSAS